MYKNTYFSPIEKTSESEIRISPPPIKPKFGSETKKRPADNNFYTPLAKKQCIS